MSKEELTLIKRVQQGDEAAFNELYQIYYGKSYAIAYRILNCDADAKDAAQETMLQVHRSIQNLKEPKFFYTWLIRITISKCNRIYRKEGSVVVDPMKIQNMKPYEETRSYMLPDHVVDDLIDRDILLGLIYSLKPQVAKVLDMMYIQQMKLVEIAEALNISVNTVKSRVVRGRLELKERIKEFETAEERRINFHMELPLSVFGYTLIVESMKSASKRVVNQITGYASGGAAQMACVASFSMLAISGAVFITEDVYNANHPVSDNTMEEDTSQSIETRNADEQKQVKKEIAFSENTFVPVAYEDTQITSSLDAYYTCINWAYDEDEMKQKEGEEIEKILPVYESLKQKNDVFYQKLVQKGWVSIFESLR